MSHQSRHLSPAVLTLVLLLPAVAFASTSPDGPSSITAASPDLVATARRVPLKGALRLTALQLEGYPGPSDLELERFRVFTPGARIVIDGTTNRPVPDNLYFKGRIIGDPSSRVLLTFRQNGEMRGLVLRRGELWVLAGGTGTGIVAPGLVSRRAEPDLELADRIAAFRCETDALLTPEDRVESPAPSSTPSVVTEPAAGPSYTARVALETDYEYYAHFGDETDALDYAADLVAYSSTIYQDETDTSLEIDYTSLWTTPGDPWGTDDYNDDGWIDCLDRLLEYRAYWMANRTTVDRTLVHMLSGKPTGCGIAYLGGLCSKVYGYGLSGNFSYNFDINDPGIGWDIMVVSHEIGHNFNSPHTHCYNGIGGNSQPVDKCYSGEGGCYIGAESLPCSGQSGCGTLMSYCHLYRGWFSDISLTFGAGHLYGVEPDRVPERMQAHVVSRANSYPGCLDPVIQGTELTVTTLGNGTGTVTSLDGGIDCGSDCSETYELDAEVNLTATPGPNSTLDGWSGDPDCSDGSLTMDEDKICTATFNLVERSLSVSKAGSGSGTVTSNPSGINCGGDCQESYIHGTSVQLTATPASGSVFAGWTGDADCDDNTVSMSSDKSCNAIFDLVQRSLTVSRTGTGSGTVTSSPAGIDCGSDCQHSWNHGTSVQLTATPEAESVFTGWSGHGDCGDGQLTLDADKSCTADFQALYLLTVDRAGVGSGTVTSSPVGIDCGIDCTESYLHGTGVSLMATPDFGSELTGWSGHVDCGDGQLSMTEPRSCTVTFELCSIDNEENFSGETVADTREYVACNILTAGNFLIQAPGGDVTFRAGNTIILEDGFVVESGASFRAVIGPPD